MATKLSIIGTGNMSEAILSGILKNKIFKASEIIGFDINKDRLAFIKKKYKIRTTTDLKVALEKTQAILLAVKPQQMGDLLNQIKEHLEGSPLLITIAAGLDIRFYKKHLGSKIKIARLMPNTPLLLGLGATGYYLDKNCKKKDKTTIVKIFSSIGLLKELNKESLLDSVTGLSGSGPAFVYAFIEAMIDGGKKAGLTQNQSFDLTLQTLKGAIAMVEQTQDDIPTLIKKVTSKGGTTEAGLKHMHKKKFKSIVSDTILTAQKRAKELRK